MAVFTVTDDVLKSAAAQEYFSRADRRVMIGLRAALEILGLPVPEYATRKPPGRPPAKALAAAYDADHGVQKRLPPLPSMSADRRAAAVSKARARLAVSAPSNIPNLPD